MFCLFVLTAILVTCTVGFKNVPFIANDDDIALAEEIQQTFRLPNNTRPETYDIRIRTWIHNGNETFTGFVRIGIIAVESTNFITLHHSVQSIESVRVLSENEVPIDIGDYSYDFQYEFFTIPVTGNNLIEGTRYFIEIEYVGTMNSYSGFYRSYYNIDGGQRWFGSTQFEATNARRAFPCYDEPALKSDFSIQITHDSSYSAISNMPTIGDTPVQNPDGSVTTLFETTPRMSTFLIAFHVSDFTYVTSSTPQHVPQRIFARSNAINETDLVLEAGELLLDSLSEYIGIDYSLPKMDQVGVPGFPSGAMENWGLVTYYENYFLFNEATDFFTRPINVVLTISHELAHQWLGNLVTPRWWTYLWMKEGAATFFEYLGVDLVYPDWNMMDFFVVDVIHYVFIPDGYVSSQPMTNFVENPYEIEAQFNYVAYAKAGSVLRMFWYYFGEDTFMRGLNMYLQDNAYSDAAEEELFDALALSVWLDDDTIIPPTANVSTIMASWTRQSGFPLIIVERNYDNQTDQVTLKQERYYSYFTPEEPENTTWWVPYNFATPNNPGFENTRVEGWIPQNASVEIVVNSLGANDYLLMNKKAAGYYRIMYDERNYRLISDAILRNRFQFHTTNIAQLFNDVNDFIQTGRRSYRPFLDLMRVLEFDTNYVSWNPVFLVIWYLNANFRGHQNYPLWADFVRSLTEQLYDTVGIEDIPNEPILQKFSRESVVQLACQMGSVHCRSDAVRQLRDHIATGREFHHNIRHVIMCASLRSGSRNDFHFVWNRMMSYPLEDYGSRSELITALSCSTSRQLLNEFLRSSLNSTNENNVIYSPYESNSVLNAIIANAGPLGLDLVLDFLIENAVEALETYGFYVMFELSNVVSRADHIERYKIFQNILLDEGLITQEQIDFNDDRVAESVEWLNTHGAVINAWLLENYV